MGVGEAGDAFRGEVGALGGQGRPGGRDDPGRPVQCPAHRVRD